jgi:hypothetical protein
VVVRHATPSYAPRVYQMRNRSPPRTLLQRRSIGRISFLVIEMVGATMQPLALSGGRFYSMGVSSPILTIGSTLSGPTFHIVDATRYATLRASDPNPCPTLAIVFFAATLPSLEPSWR